MDVYARKNKEKIEYKVKEWEEKHARMITQKKMKVSLYSL